MAIVRYYFDDDVGQTALIASLRRMGIDAITSLEAGSFGLPDAEHLARATELQRVVCTGNRADFTKLHTDWLRSGRTHAGIVLIVRHRYSVGELARRLARITTELSAEEMQDRIEYVSNWPVRQ